MLHLFESPEFNVGYCLKVCQLRNKIEVSKTPSKHRMWQVLQYSFGWGETYPPRSLQIQIVTIGAHTFRELIDKLSLAVEPCITFLV